MTQATEQKEVGKLSYGDELFFNAGFNAEFGILRTVGSNYANEQLKIK
jgi:uncharacterized cupin superfamily protein